jgi:DNA-binding beta-propeller fold protein YncE
MCFWLHSVEAISGASYDSKSFSFSGQASQGAGIEFSPDGTKHYVTNGSGNIYQYTCSTAWDASTCTYASKTCNATAQTGSSHTVIFNATGTKMYTNSNTNQYQYSLSSAYDISTCSYDSVTLSTAAQDGSTYESKWSSDGTKYYVLGVEFDKVYQYSCSSAYSLSSCTYSKFLSVATQELYPWGLEIRSDGKKVYVSGGNETIYRYGCTTAWEMDTCTYDSDSYSVSSTVGGIYATGLVFKPDGTKMYVSGWTSGNNVYQFSTAETWPSAAPASIGLGFGGFF